ncbi:MAG: TetR family transcriptional regulator [Ramlibacter sp.]|nr:TetR family transcriptional regulator [Ramlibacter sp.]
MPRNSKEEALATRSRLLDAAERVFQDKGMSGTSLADIAAAAGTTRGAIYWHFRNKADLFNAMIERVTLPLEHALRQAASVEADDPLPAMRRAMMAALKKTVSDPQTRRVFEVATHKVEYVDGLCAVRQRHISVRAHWIDGMKLALTRSASHRGVRLPAPAETVARGLHALLDGLIQNWLLDTSAFDLQKSGRIAVDAYLKGVGL